MHNLGVMRPIRTQSSLSRTVADDSLRPCPLTLQLGRSSFLEGSRECLRRAQYKNRLDLSADSFLLRRDFENDALTMSAPTLRRPIHISTRVNCQHASKGV